MAKILISYRREDSAYPAGGIRDQLAAHFGRENVFIDVDSIPFGHDFRTHLDRSVGACDYLIAVIGRSWLTVCDAGGRRRLDDPADFVRLEIEAALKREIPVIPVLVDNVPPPRPDQMPDSLSALSYRNAISIRPPPDFNNDVERLARGIDEQDKQRLQQAAQTEQQRRAATAVSPPAEPSRLQRKVWRPRAKLLATGVGAALLTALLVWRFTKHDDSAGKSAASGGLPAGNSDPASSAAAAAPVSKTTSTSSPAGPNWLPPLGTAATASGAAPAVAPARPAAAGSEPITNSIGMKLTPIPAGEFMMGSPENEPGARADEHPRHLVRITKPFYLGTYSVTRGQFSKFVVATGYKTDAETDGKGGAGFTGETGDLAFAQEPEFSWRNPGYPQTDEHPVVNVGWNDAVAFCKWLSDQEGKTYRLPTEAEWEYACRAGTATAYLCGDNPEDLAKCANVADAALKERFPDWKFPTIKASDGYVFTAPVGSFLSNRFGLYDMQGNVCQWCSDWYGTDYYASSPPADPQGPSAGSWRAYRSGSWNTTPANCRCSLRAYNEPAFRDDYLGFRVVRGP